MQGNGGTFHLQRHQDGVSSGTSLEEFGTAPQTAREMQGIEHDGEISRRQQLEQERQQQVRQAFGDQLRVSAKTLTQRMLPQQRPEIHSMSSDEELVEDMQGQLAPQTSSQTPPSLPAPPSMYLRQIVYTDTLRTWMRRNVKELQTQMFFERH